MWLIPNFNTTGFLLSTYLPSFLAAAAALTLSFLAYLVSGEYLAKNLNKLLDPFLSKVC